jgi:hypothetical protein
MTSEEGLHRLKEKGNILIHTTKEGRLTGFGHTLRINGLLKHVIERDKRKKEVIKVTGRRGRRRKKLLDDLDKTRGYW